MALYQRWGIYALRTLFFASCIVCLSHIANAQKTFTISGGPNTKQHNSYYYFYDGNEYLYAWSYMNYSYYYYHGNRTQIVVTAADMQYYGMCAGPINQMGLAWLVSNPQKAKSLEIRMKQIPSSQYGVTYAFDNNGYTLVYSNTAYQRPTSAVPDTNWQYFNFSQQFVWDGTSNLLIDWWEFDAAPDNNYYYSLDEFWATETRLPTGTNYPSDSYQWPQRWAYQYQGQANTPQWQTCTQGYYPAYLYQYNYNTGVGGYRPTRPVFRFSIFSGVTQSFPDDVDPRRILRTGVVYDGSTTARPKPSVSIFQSVGDVNYISYRIVGPLPSTDLQYEARSAGGTNVVTHVPTFNGEATVTWSNAIGPLAGTGGALNLTDANGGAYRAEITVRNSCGENTIYKGFIIAFPNDVAMADIREPRPLPVRYPYQVRLPLSALIQNVGLNDVTDADVAVTVRGPAGNIVHTDDFRYSGELKTGERASVTFSKTYIANAVGTHTVRMCVDLLNAVDLQPGNNCLPLSGVYDFEINYNEEVGSRSIDIPRISGAEYYESRPFRPQGTIENFGILDLSDIPVRMEIFDPQGARVYNQIAIVPSVEAMPPFNIAVADFPFFTPTVAGRYRACLTTEYPGDPVLGNNKVCIDFDVIPAMCGTYTIGRKNLGANRNYPSIDVAVDDLYRRGVSCSVIFELTDGEYNIGSVLSSRPAIDLSGRIIGMGQNATVTFKPSAERALSKGAVKITLNTATGVGVLMGQSTQPSSQFALINQFPFFIAYANSDGYFIFDGGIQKSLQFQLNTTATLRAPFYLGDGSRHITIKNCVITNAPTSAPSYMTSIPNVNYVGSQFVFQPDVRVLDGVTYAYTAGIVNRAKLPSGQSGNNSERVDTIKSDNNAFIGNEISGFGYGIVSLGIGVAIKGGVNEYRTYYNENTKISDNVIYGVRGGGIFSGYEKGALISGNRIYNIGVSTTGGAGINSAAIQVGGAGRYHNVNTLVEHNEINTVTSDVMARGIVVEMVRNQFPNISTGANIFFPNVEENVRISGNIVRDIRRTNASASAAAIHVLTQRNPNVTGVDALISPAVNNENYFGRGVRILNNTIVMDHDNVNNGSGAIAAIGVQHQNAAIVTNNAIVMQTGASASLLSQSALLYQGVDLHQTESWGLVSESNAVQLGHASMARVIEITRNSEVLSTGFANEFKTLAQWRAWTGRDLNTAEGDILTDHVLVGVAPNQLLRIKSNPTPLNSLINNRGERMADVTHDLIGQVRGAAGLPFDIGAIEFDGRIPVSDLAVIGILTPSAYRSVVGNTSDAEYIMTPSPVNVTARIRNTGSLTQTNARVRVRIFMETQASSNSEAAMPTWAATPVVDRTVNVASLGSGDNADIDFAVPNFRPATYGDLTGYSIPARFSTMFRNVSPRYNIEVSVQSDADASNNVVNKDVRFYVQRSAMRMLVSVRNSNTMMLTNPAPSTSQVIGRLNADSLIKGLRYIGFYNDAAGNRHDFDVFERSGWEERAVNYATYRTIFYGGDNMGLSRFERLDLRRFIGSGILAEKKNLVVGSQEYVRRHLGMDQLNDEMFVNRILRAQYVPPGTPVPSTQNYHNRRIIGHALTIGSVERLARTGVPGDPDPNPALMRPYSDAFTSGIATMAFTYDANDRTTPDSVAGIASASLTSTVSFIGVDWRHYGRNNDNAGIERVLRGAVDYIEKNGGHVVPVELVSFDAKPRGNDVDILWKTASEQGSAWFDVERADITLAGVSDFNTVATVPAAGNSNAERYYNVTDRDLTAGTYAYRLRAVDVDGSASTTHTILLEIGPGAVASQASIHPLPASSFAKLTYHISSGGFVSVNIVDVNGSLVTPVFSGEQRAGRQELELPTNLAAGAYTVVISAPGVQFSTGYVLRR